MVRSQTLSGLGLQKTKSERRGSEVEETKAIRLLKCNDLLSTQGCRWYVLGLRFGELLPVQEVQDCLAGVLQRGGVGHLCDWLLSDYLII